jgi:hypothetical protein
MTSPQTIWQEQFPVIKGMEAALVLSNSDDLEDCHPRTPRPAAAVRPAFVNSTCLTLTSGVVGGTLTAPIPR